MARRSVRLLASIAAVATMATTFAACGNKQATTDENGKPIVNILVRRNVTDHPMQDTQYTKDLEAACDLYHQVAGSLRQRLGPAEERQDGRR